ncbi:MAG: hypothetical protein KGD60_01435 [Candidatus Thorarchaeota archaeon]|nr:hypothetical protein [Candidatus Thorarchaeota archaeon]
MGARRFAGPSLMFILGTLVMIQMILTITQGMPSIAFISDTLSLNLGTDVIAIMAIAFPILFLEYYLFAVPIAVVLLLGTKIIKSNRYELNIMNIGRNFGAPQLVRRAAAPALFAVATAYLFRKPLQVFLFGINPDIAPEFASLFPVVVSIMSALLAVPIALLLFMPTWVLNDAGVVTHLKSDNLRLRQCPDTQGVGRWIANMLGGYALLAFPITMFLNHFYEPLILPIIEGMVFTPEQVIFQVTTGALWTLGLPFFVMAFILPIIMFNEAMQTRSTVRILKLARRLGAKIVRKEQIQEIKRLSSAYDEEQKATVSLYAQAGNQQIVSTQKSIKSKSKTKSTTESSPKKQKTTTKQKKNIKSKKSKK